jgi:FKBP-type peptidyl-prolyl cis-trans isomerase
MNFVKKIFNTVTICCLAMLLMSLSCSKSEDEPVVTPLRDFAVQRDSDMLVIEKYLTDYTFTVTNNPGFANDKDIIFSKITNPNTQPSIKSLMTSTTFPKLLEKKVSYDGIEYKLYYLVVNEGNTLKKPTRVDEVLIAYNGRYLENQSGVLGANSVFEDNPIPNSLFKLLSSTGTAIRGWLEIIPQFGTGTFDTTSNPNGPTQYQNYGVGAIFIPSGLAYFNQAVGTIPSYSPLVFTIKLYDLKRADQDLDGVLSIDEDLNNNGIFTDDDTDADGISNYGDNDDDNDGYTTKTEFKKNDGTENYFNLSDIPSCSGGNGLKRYLDPKCHN